MCLVANCEASGKQDPVPAKTKQDDADLPTNFFFCLASLTAAELSGRQAGMRIPQVLFEPIRASWVRLARSVELSI